MSDPPFQPALITPARITRRRMAVLTFVVFMTGLASLLMADLLWGSPLQGWAALVWFLFTVLFSFVAFGAAHAVFGFMVRRSAVDNCSIRQSLPATGAEVPLAPTAIVLPVHNESPGRIFAGIEAILLSLARTGRADSFHFFILSDSTDPDHWIEEETGWARLVARYGLADRLFYRRRRANSNKKAGNIADFCRRWGRRYRYMVVLDADSIMAGETIVELVRLMECNPATGLIQTAPTLIRAESLIARTLQFAARLYGPIFQAGLNYWQLGEGNYWGHNAIIRLAPFIKHCSLPPLPGREPFGGHILSHDFVEAALLRRAGWGVWLVPELGGSYEELPPTLIDLARRDRRWAQGNMQHLWILFARGLHGVSRVHLLLGVFSYCSSLLWLASLVLGSLLAIGFSRTGLTWLPQPALADLVGADAGLQAVAITLFTFALLFGPKLLAVLDLALRPRGLAGFGGGARVAAGVLVEMLLSVLLAPILMLFHTRFVVATLLGQGVRWGPQRRDGQTGWTEAATAHASHTLIGLLWAILLAVFAPALLPWMAPVLLGLLLAIPFSQLTSRESLGRAAARRGWLATPEELAPPRELRDLTRLLAAQPAEAEPPFARAVVDPRTNALHCALQRERRRQHSATRRRLDSLRARLLRDGPGGLAPAEKNFLLSDPTAMTRIHREVWSRDPSTLANFWQEALERSQAGPPDPEPVHDSAAPFAPVLAGDSASGEDSLAAVPGTRPAVRAAMAGEGPFTLPSPPGWVPPGC